jgi:HK97 family phage prohead protease
MDNFDQSVPFECSLDLAKAYEDSQQWIVEGYAATSDFDLQNDIITEQAIKNSAKDLLDNSTVLLNHNQEEPIGRVLESKAQKGRLFVKVLISKTAQDVWQKIKEGVLNKFSVRGMILDAQRKWAEDIKKYVRLILKMQLVEVSLVSVPANPKAKSVRWYIEKALGDKLLDNVEDDGYDKQVLEVSRMPSGFPPPEELEKEWSEHVNQIGIDKGSCEQSYAAWLSFCKAHEYPYPYPYPYPKPGSNYPYPKPGGEYPGPGAEDNDKMLQAVQLVEKLTADERDEARLRLFEELKGLLSSMVYPVAKGKEEEEEVTLAAKAGKLLADQQDRKIVETIKAVLDKTIELDDRARKLEAKLLIR